MVDDHVGAGPGGLDHDASPDTFGTARHQYGLVFESGNTHSRFPFRIEPRSPHPARPKWTDKPNLGARIP